MTVTTTERRGGRARGGASRTSRTETVPTQTGRTPAARAQTARAQTARNQTARNQTRTPTAREQTARTGRTRTPVTDQARGARPAPTVVRGRRVAVRTPAGAKAAPFVVLVMALLAGGLVATLWLSTAAAADTYRLQGIRDDITSLSDENARLRRDVEGQEAIPSLARYAADAGMVPVGGVPRIVVHPDGSHTLVGKPTPAPSPTAATPMPPATSVPPTTPTRRAPEAQAGLPPANGTDGEGDS